MYGRNTYLNMKKKKTELIQSSQMLLHVKLENLLILGDWNVFGNLLNYVIVLFILI